MIEFNGYLTGKAEKYFKKRSRIIALKIVIYAILMFLPVIIISTMYTGLYAILGGYFAIIIALPLILFIPKSKKEQLSMLPKRIYVEDEHIVSISDQYEEIKKLCDVKAVYMYDDFYEIRFPFGKISEKFICQKSLLTNGTLKEFEKLFFGKLVDKTGDGLREP